MRTTSFVLAALLAAGCATEAERSAQMQREVDHMVAVYGPSCEKLGFASGSEGWRNCVLRLNTDQLRYSYRAMPSTTTCFGHRGFFQCSTF
jgi:hypothetical protein